MNLELQGRYSLIVNFIFKLRAFIKRLQNWRRKVQLNISDIFITLTETIDNGDITNQFLQLIAQHLASLEFEFLQYFPEINDTTSSVIVSPFTALVTSFSDKDEATQNQLIDIQQDLIAKNLFATLSLNDFWCSMLPSYPLLGDIAIRALLPFSSTYLCESGFSHLVDIKTKQRIKMTYGVPYPLQHHELIYFAAQSKCTLRIN